MQTKSWVHVKGALHYPMAGTTESHFVCVQTSDDMASGRPSTSGHHFGGIVWAGPGEREKFEQRPNVYALGHIHKNATIHDDVADALVAYGVQRGDGLRDAIEKVVSKSGVHSIALGEI